MTTLTGKAVGATSRWVDDRLGSSNFMRRTLNKIFPDHWSFMLGEIALYSFVVLLITGTWLTMFFDASMKEVIYHGAYVPLDGVKMSDAYATTVKLSWDVRGGLMMRQIHHWAALLFVCAIVVHISRIFFTGAFRKPREINWLIGVGLLVMAIAEGFAGYSLPDDLLSGTGLRIAYSIAESIPVIGSWVCFLVFGGQWPGDAIITRLYPIHILLIPGILVALITAHMMILWHQKHTQFRGPGRTEDNVVGSRMYPHYAAHGGAFFFFVFGVLAAMGGLAQINPIWLYGPYSADNVSAGSQPDWYVGWLEGSLRLMPNWEWRGFGYDIPFNVLMPAVVLPGAIFTVLALYPFIEEKLTGDRDWHHLLDRPRDRPVRTAVGVMALSYYFILMAAGGNDIIASIFHISLNATTWFFRIFLLLAPPAAFYVTHRICLALQDSDHEMLEEGVETGTIMRLPSGKFVEIHRPVAAPSPLVLTPVEPEHAGSDALADGDGHGNGRQGLVSAAGRAVSGFFVERREPEVGEARPPRG